MSGARVAIACQGGGSHTAFTAGALTELLPVAVEDYELIGLSGTSGGAMCATAAWYGLCNEGPDRAIEKLEALWDDIAVGDPVDSWINASLQAWTAMADAGLPTVDVSPDMAPASKWGQDHLRETLERHIDFQHCHELMGPDTPSLVVGAVDVTEGSFETFVDEAVDAEALLASSAVPELFPAVSIDGNDYWDGLFSQNPPIRDLVKGPIRTTPDELWVVQINPQTNGETPSTPSEIADRRNELAGNLALNQELHGVRKVNQWVEAGYLPEPYTYVEVRRLELPMSLSAASKQDRSADFVEELYSTGREEARAFLEELE